MSNKRPEKIEFENKNYTTELEFHEATYGADSYNKAIDECRAYYEPIIKAKHLRIIELEMKLLESEKQLQHKADVEELAAYAAQGYCTKRNEHKVLDPDLLEDIATAINKWIKGE